MSLVLLEDLQNNLVSDLVNLLKAYAPLTNIIDPDYIGVTEDFDILPFEYGDGAIQVKDASVDFNVPNRSIHEEYAKLYTTVYVYKNIADNVAGSALIGSGAETGLLKINGLVIKAIRGKKTSSGFYWAMPLGIDDADKLYLFGDEEEEFITVAYTAIRFEHRINITIT